MRGLRGEAGLQRHENFQQILRALLFALAVARGAEIPCALMPTGRRKRQWVALDYTTLKEPSVD